MYRNAIHVNFIDAWRAVTCLVYTNAFFWNHPTPLFGKDESGKEKSRLKGVVVGVYNHVLPNIVVTAIYKCRLDLDRDV